MRVLPFFLACLLGAANAHAVEAMVSLNSADAKGIGTPVGSVRIVETPYGLAFYPALTGLAPGVHGFHIHENPSCAPGTQGTVSVPALAAGGHLDPKASNTHGEPWGDGHLGDLPALYVGSDGRAVNAVLAPRLKFADVLKRSLMIHAGGDNHSDHPVTLGGGGARVACGVIGG